MTKPGVEGDLIYCGDNVMMGYAQTARDLASGDLCNGHLETGDIATVDENNLYYIRGRKARFIKVFGNRIGLDDLEALLEDRHCPAVATGRDDKLVLAAADADSLEAASEIVKSVLRIHHSAIGVVIMDKLPRSSAGKILYSEVMAAYDAQLAATAKP